MRIPKLQYKGFCAQVGYDKEDGIWVGEVLQIIGNYLHFCKKMGKTPEVTRI